MTFEEFWARQQYTISKRDREFAEYVWQAATEQSQARIAELEDKLYWRDQECDILAAQVAMLREALERADQISGYPNNKKVLTATSSDWLKRHDAKVLRKAEGYVLVRTALDYEQLMIGEKAYYDAVKRDRQSKERFGEAPNISSIPASVWRALIEAQGEKHD